MSALLRPLLIAISALYPLIWYYGREHIGVRALALIMLLLWLARAYTTPTQRLPALLIAAFFAIILLIGHAQTLYWYPVLVNLLMLILFASSLYSRQSLIERLARLQTPNLPPHAIAYTRRVTQIWCAFFLLNGSIAALLILLHAYRAWALYTGLIAYLLMALLLGGEWLYRKTHIQQHEKISQT